MKNSIYGRDADQPDIRDSISLGETALSLVRYIGALTLRAEGNDEDAVVTLRLLSCMADAEIERKVRAINSARLSGTTGRRAK